MADPQHPAALVAVGNRPAGAPRHEGIGLALRPDPAAGADPSSPAAAADDWLAAVCEPALDPLFWPATRLGAPSAWWAHVPFANWLVCAAAPRVLVELGTYTGVSYAAFCQAVRNAGLPTRCHAVDSWRGDRHAGEYGDEVYEDFRRYHDARFAQFSTLLRCEFDAARAWFADGSIDLLHIDGLHTYEAVRHDFESWKPKLSERAVVLFHDTNVRQLDFGVWRLWQELCEKHPSFEFLHGYGLGVLALGAQAPAPVMALCRLDDAHAVATLRHRFAALGERWWQAGLAVQAEADLAASRGEVERLNASLAEQRARVQQVEAENAALGARIERLRASLSWRITMPLRRAPRLLDPLRRLRRRG